MSHATNVDFLQTLPATRGVLATLLPFISLPRFRTPSVFQILKKSIVKCKGIFFDTGPHSLPTSYPPKNQHWMPSHPVPCWVRHATVFPIAIIYMIFQIFISKFDFKLIMLKQWYLCRIAELLSSHRYRSFNSIR